MPRQTIALTKWLLKRLFQLGRVGTPGIIALLSLFLSSHVLASSGWQKLAPGIEYQDLENNFWSHIHAFRIDLKNNQLSLIMAQDLSLNQASIDTYAQRTKALITVNGGFFDHHYHPLGLRIDDKKQKNPIKFISWWGIFYIKNQKPYITNTKHVAPLNQIELAIQSGPRLLIDGKIPALKPGQDERSALGITSDGRVIVLVTENRLMSTTELAELMKAPSLNCKNALNLDGGSSSQIHAQIHQFQLNVPGLSNVSDAIIVNPR